MKCPIDNTDLVMSERQGIEIDYCPKCRGIWLDRGELDKIIERSDTDDDHHEAPRQQPVPQPAPQYHEPHDRQHSSHHHDPRYYKHKKRKNFLSEIFDFD